MIQPFHLHNALFKIKGKAFCKQGVKIRMMRIIFIREQNQVMTQYKIELKNNCGKPITKHMPFIIVVAFHININ
jgi:hypothetical protein